MGGEALVWAVLLPMLLGVMLSFMLERLLQPATLVLWQRPRATVLIHTGLWLLVFCFELAVFRRPWFAAAMVSSFFLLVVLVNNAKFHSLSEPFIFQDFEYFTDALKHPRLYLPFLGLGRAIVASGAFVLVVYAGLVLEPSLTSRMAMAEFALVIIVLIMFALGLLWLGARQSLRVVFAPESDFRQLGLLASIWCYGVAERQPINLPVASQLAPPSISELPNLVVVQSESFFDARRLFSGIRPEVLQTFDEIKATAVCHGQIEVPAWGANTVRTEFAFLSGLDADSLGVHRFNPYRKLARQGIPTLASRLQQSGYRTVCVHPYPASFYARDEVYPLLGFDEFVDIRQFVHVEQAGPYIGDIALAEKVCALLEATSDKPLFVFVITMENHGPLHLEQVQAGDVERLYVNPPSPACEELTIYLRHLCNADNMMAILRNQLTTLPKNGLLCWYGDHVPILPKVYAEIGLPDGQTDYFIWAKNGGAASSLCRNAKIEHLGEMLLQQMT